MTLHWRKYLTPGEAAVVRASDDAAATIKRMRADYRKRWAVRRQLIVNRAIKRANYARFHKQPKELHHE